MKTKKRAFRIILTVICIFAALLIAVGATVILVPKSEVRYVAHRGYSDRYVDNTAEAFKAAAKMSFYGVETDVRETAKNRLFRHVRGVDGRAPFKQKDGLRGQSLPF